MQRTFLGGHIGPPLHNHSSSLGAAQPQHGVLLEATGKSGKIKALYKLEEATEDENLLIKEFAIDKYHIEKHKINGVGVYTS